MGMFGRIQKILNILDRGTEGRTSDDIQESKRLVKIVMQGIQKLKDGQGNYEAETAA